MMWMVAAICFWVLCAIFAIGFLTPPVLLCAWMRHSVSGLLCGAILLVAELGVLALFHAVAP